MTVKKALKKIGKLTKKISNLPKKNQNEMEFINQKIYVLREFIELKLNIEERV